MTADVLRATGLTKTFGKKHVEVRAVDDVDIVIQEGEMVAIVGPSGSGKSTLLHMLAGLRRPDKGSVVLKGVDVARVAERHMTRIRREHIGMVFQRFHLVPTLTAYENILLPMNLHGREVDDAWFREVVGVLGIDAFVDRYPEDLSGGQQQRVALARAVVGRPSIVFADEPTGNLDRQSGRQTIQFMRNLVDHTQVAVVVVTHDLAMAQAAHRIERLEDGRLNETSAELAGVTAKEEAI